MKKFYSKKNPINLINFLIDLWKNKFLFFKVIFFMFLINSPFFFQTKYTVTIDSNYLYLDNILNKFNLSENDNKIMHEQYSLILSKNFFSTRKLLNEFNQIEINQNSSCLIYEIKNEPKNKNFESISFYLSHNINKCIKFGNYLDFIINKSNDELTLKLKILLKKNIIEHEKALEIATMIDFKDPLIKEKKILDEQDLQVSNNFFLYYLGTKILNVKINQFERLIKNFNSDSIIFYTVSNNFIISKLTLFQKLLFYLKLIFKIVVISFILYFFIIFYRNLKKNSH